MWERLDKKEIVQRRGRRFRHRLEKIKGESSPLGGGPQQRREGGAGSVEAGKKGFFGLRGAAKTHLMQAVGGRGTLRKGEKEKKKLEGEKHQSILN